MPRCLPPNSRSGWVLGFVENVESEKREPGRQDRPPLRLTEGLWGAGGSPAVTEAAQVGTLLRAGSRWAGRTLRRCASIKAPAQHPAWLTQVGKAHSAPQRGGSSQPQRACLFGLLVLGTKHQDLLFTDGYRHLGSKQLGVGHRLWPFSLRSPGLLRLLLRQSNHSLLLHLAISPPLLCNLGLLLLCQGLKARRDGQAGVLSLVSGQRGCCDRGPECV